MVTLVALVAIDATRGVVMLAGGQPIDAVYHSSSGGATENSEEVWSYATSYLRTKPDPMDFNSQHYNWQYPTSGEMSMSQVAARLKTYKGWNFGTITNVVSETMTTSGNRIQVLRIEGTDTSGNPLTQRLTKADNVRSAFGLKSGPREVVVNLGLDMVPTGIVFKGSGWGHGLGMSQWGARGMAEAGNDYRSILQYYYTGVTIAENYGE
ncbi:MAG TPA: SpoIID/LytB domain-containing protein [Bacillota bacterium]|nr:SpoIID/LytB domain-containing protein [Bacillota bacterium]